jgi:glycosyltransferase involved in cell wall biosynthesis
LGLFIYTFVTENYLKYLMNKTPKNKITGLVITFNEEKNIEEVILNLDFVDELIIVDSFSTDKTVAIVSKYPNIKFIQNKFENYTSQRNLALKQASHQWILFIDADERVSEKLKNEIIETVNNKTVNTAFFVCRKFMFQGKHLRFSGWQTDKNIRLFLNGKAEYVSNKLVHEKLTIYGSVGKLKNKLIHNSFTDYESYKQKMIYYGKLKAKELFLKGVKPNAFHFIIKPTYKFLYSYIFRLGILDGKKGIQICYLNALSIYTRYPELKKLNKNNPIFSKI